MNKKLGLAVAGALLAASASAQAGIVIPAGDWTIDINGNVNTYASWTNAKTDRGTVTGAIAVGKDDAGERHTQSIGTGLLPAWLGVTGKTRQNDLDIEFTISMQPGSSDNGVTGDGATSDRSQESQFLNRQTYVKFGDASWGSVKLGKDLGVFGSDAILNDMTLLGVGAHAYGNSGMGDNTTLGGIGSGYIYAAWKGQIAYTSPNWNGFQFTAAITNPNQNFGDLYQDRFGLEGKASYAWTGDFSGKVWASFASYDVTGDANSSTTGVQKDSYKADVYDIGATVSYSGFGLTGYYYNGDGVGTTFLGSNGVYRTGNKFKKRDSDGGYVQATYILPTSTKIGLAYGKSNLDEASGENDGTLLESNKRWTVGAYHPLTKSLNLVAEWNKITSEGQSSANKVENTTASVGAILFF